MTGEELYKLWCDAPGSDRERYWMLMNPADKQLWEMLALRVRRR